MKKYPLIKIKRNITVYKIMSGTVKLCIFEERVIGYFIKFIRFY